MRHEYHRHCRQLESELNSRPTQYIDENISPRAHAYDDAADTQVSTSLHESPTYDCQRVRDDGVVDGHAATYAATIYHEAAASRYAE